MKRLTSDTEQSTTEEPAAVYGRKDGIAQLLKFNGLLSENISGSVLAEIPKVTNLSVKEIVEILEISKPNFYRQKSKLSLDIRIIDKLAVLLHLFNQGKNAFGGLRDFSRWLNQENLHLGNICPKILLKTETGRTRIEIALGRIEHGIYG